MSNDKNQQNQKHQNKGQQNRGNNRDRNHGRPRPVIKEMELFFIEQRYGDGSSTPVAIQNGIRIYPRSPRFNPECSTEQDYENGTQKLYTCLVRLWPEQDGGGDQGEQRFKDVADCMPKVWQTLSPDEYLPQDEWLKAIVVPLTFTKDRRDGKPKAFHKGKVVLVDRDSEVSLDESRLYMLSYGGRVAFAHALPRAGGVSGQSSALVVSMAERLGETTVEELTYIVMEEACNKSGVVIPRTDKDLVVKKKRKNIYTLLGIPTTATKEEIKRAFHQKSRATHPDAVLSKLKNPTVKDEKNVKFFFEAVNKAYESALQVIDRRTKKTQTAPAVEVPSPAPEAPAAAVQASEPVDETVELTETVVTDTAPAVESPAELVSTPAKAAPSEEDVIIAAAALASLSVEEFKAKKNEAPGYYRSYVRQAQSKLTPKVGNGGESKSRKERKAKEKKSNADVLAEMRANLAGGTKE